MKQIIVTVLLNFLTFSGLAQTYDETYRRYFFQEKPHTFIHSEKTNLGFPQLTRHSRHAPFFAGAAVGAIVANNRHLTHNAPSYYYPPSYGYYPSGSYRTHG